MSRKHETTCPMYHGRAVRYTGCTCHRPLVDLPGILLTPDQAAQFEHVAYDGEHPANGLAQSCPVCSGHTSYTKGLIEDYAVLAFPNSPLAQRRKEQGL